MTMQMLFYYLFLLLNYLLYFNICMYVLCTSQSNNRFNALILYNKNYDNIFYSFNKNL